MITTIMGIVKFKENHLLLNAVFGVLKTEDGPLDLTLAHGISRISLVKGTLPIKYDSTTESKLDNLGILREVETFNKQFPTVVQGYRDELFKFDNLPKDKNKLDWLAEMRATKFNLMEHIIKCNTNNTPVTFKLSNSTGEQCTHINGVITDVWADILDVKVASNVQTKISTNDIISITYGG